MFALQFLELKSLNSCFRGLNSFEKVLMIGVPTSTIFLVMPLIENSY